MQGFESYGGDKVADVYSLLIETATERVLVALAREAELVTYELLPPGEAASRSLVPRLEALMASQSLRVADLTYVTCGIGPGSFTGIRVGVAAAQGLALARFLPLVSLCSLEGFIPSQDGVFCSLVDARSGGAYAMKGRREGSQIVERGEVLRVPWEQLLTFLGETTRIVTPGRGALEAHFSPFVDQAESWMWEECHPDPHYLIRRAHEKYLAKEYSTSGQLELLYLRKTQAERVCSRD